MIPSLSETDFEKISRLAYEHFGLHLPEGKQALVAARLGKEMRLRGAENFSQYYRHVREDATGQALISLIDALTTNYTSFLREPQHFELMSSLATSVYRNHKSLRIWSAACSSGEEPYSIAMTLAAAGSRHGCPWRAAIRIFATDISTKVLAIAQRAVYEAEKFNSLPKDWLRQFLLKGTGDSSGYFQIKPELRSMVEFKRFNLMDALPQGEFEFIWCRNVMIYFDRATQQSTVRRLAERLGAGGYLFIGHSETLNGLDQPLRYIRPAVYRKEARA
jgi:chemotaxis protein methyltransferase CheR